MKTRKDLEKIIGLNLNDYQIKTISKVLDKLMIDFFEDKNGIPINLLSDEEYSIKANKIFIRILEFYCVLFDLETIDEILYDNINDYIKSTIPNKVK